MKPRRLPISALAAFLADRQSAVKRSAVPFVSLASPSIAPGVSVEALDAAVAEFGLSVHSSVTTTITPGSVGELAVVNLGPTDALVDSLLREALDDSVQAVPEDPEGRRDWVLLVIDTWSATGVTTGSPMEISDRVLKILAPSGRSPEVRVNGCDPDRVLDRLAEIDSTITSTYFHYLP